MFWSVLCFVWICVQFLMFMLGFFWILVVYKGNVVCTVLGDAAGEKFCRGVVRVSARMARAPEHQRAKRSGWHIETQNVECACRYGGVRLHWWSVSCVSWPARDAWC